MKKITFFCLLVGVVSMNCFAERRSAKQVFIPRLENSPIELTAAHGQYAPAMNLGTPDTIDLSDAAFNIDYIQADYYVSGGKAYYTFSIMNYDTDYPALHVEVNATSKTKIQGLQDVIVESFSYLDVDATTRFTFSQALLWFKYTGSDVFGEALYDILAYAKASDGNVYIYRGNMPIMAYDGDDVIILEDEVDDTVVEPELPKDDPSTTINHISSQTSQIKNHKLMIDGQLLILRGNELFNAQGTRVK